MATTIKVPIPASGIIYLTANCHAAWEQTLVYSSDDASYTFSGHGEGVTMKTAEGETLVEMNNQKSGGYLSLSFSSSGNPNPRVQTPIEHKSGTMMQYTVTSEDDVDNDNNDTYAMFWFNIGTPQRKDRSHKISFEPCATEASQEQCL